MPKTIIFLGAGASVAEGASCQSNLFMDYFRRKRKNKETIDDHPVEYFEAFWKINVNNCKLKTTIFPTFEEALGMLEMARDRHEGFHKFYNMPNSDKIGHTIEDLIFLMAKILHDQLDHNFYHTQLINNLITQKRLKDLAFVSLNYDILIDNAIALAHKTVDLDYAVCFANFNVHDDWHAPRKRRSVELLKVHGSLNWLYCPVCKSIWLTPKEKGVIKLISSDNKHIGCKSCGGRYVPILVPPTYFKEMSNPFLINVWERTERLLRQCEQIIFCGYSLPDADIHIKYLLKRGQLNRTGKSLTVTVLNGYPKKTRRASRDEKARYQRLFGPATVDFQEVSFQTFSDNPEKYLA
jgi:NAD-dependent SIR2 family protein deacetylase